MAQIRSQGVWFADVCFDMMVAELRAVEAAQ